VQISVDESEVKRRIEAFISRKREEINQNNLTDFIEEQGEDLCARVSSNIYRIKDSKGHLKIRRIRNEIGPLDDRSIAKHKVDENSEKIFSSIDERLKETENFLKLKSSAVPKDVYQRLKIIEDHISLLQSISPEYSQFLVHNESSQKYKTVYSVNDLDKIIASMEKSQ
jgi:hypothetical protein